jgi:uncharacterized protein DUF4282
VQELLIVTGRHAGRIDSRRGRDFASTASGRRLRIRHGSKRRDVARRRGRAAAHRSGGGLGDYLSFRKMVIPIIIQIIFWTLVTVVTIGGVAAGVIALTGRGEQKILGALMIVVGIPLSILLIRMYCELIIVVFRINDTLTDIKNILGQRRD